jgi:hypothetical protein
MSPMPGGWRPAAIVPPVSVPGSRRGSGGETIIMSGSIASVQGSFTSASTTPAMPPSALRTDLDSEPEEAQRLRPRTRPRRHRHGHPGRITAGEAGLLCCHAPPRQKGAARRDRRGALFLSSSDSTFVTGIELFVDGAPQGDERAGPGLPFTCFPGPAAYSQSRTFERRIAGQPVDPVAHSMIAEAAECLGAFLTRRPDSRPRTRGSPLSRPLRGSVQTIPEGARVHGRSIRRRRAGER